jgi:probable F420-dependent oxidoreductase
MHYAVSIFPTDYSIPMAELGPAVEERGFESLWVSEHSHIPLSRESRWPGGDELPKMYYDTLDPFVALTAAAVTTRTLKLGTGICLVTQRDPIHTAKEVSSLEQISGGRVLFGVGAGWNLEEMRDHGTDPASRFELMAERVEAIRTIWTQSKPEFHGKHVDFDPMMTWPKPVQKPHPPIHLGGGPGAARQAIAYGDGWMPIAGRNPDMEENIAGFRRRAQEAGRDASAMELSIFGMPNDADLVSRYRDLGVDRLMFLLPPDPAETLLPLLDALAEHANA